MNPHIYRYIHVCTYISALHLHLLFDSIFLDMTNWMTTTNNINNNNHTAATDSTYDRSICLYILEISRTPTKVHFWAFILKCFDSFLDIFPRFFLFFRFWQLRIANCYKTIARANWQSKQNIYMLISDVSDWKHPLMSYLRSFSLWSYLRFCI